jgi:hypothetical protein
VEKAKDEANMFDPPPSHCRGLKESKEGPVLWWKVHLYIEMINEETFIDQRGKVSQLVVIAQHLSGGSRLVKSSDCRATNRYLESVTKHSSLIPPPRFSRIPSSLSGNRHIGYVCSGWLSVEETTGEKGWTG